MEALLQTIIDHQTYIYVTTAAGGLLIFIIKRIAARFSDDIYDWIKETLLGRKSHTVTIITTPVPAGQPVAVQQMPGAGAAVAVQHQHRPGPPVQPGEFNVTTPRAAYRFRTALARGDLATVFSGTSSEQGSGEVVLKLAEDPGDADLMQTEFRTLRLLSDGAGQYGKHLPVLIEQVTTPDGRVGNVFKKLSGCFDLYSVREKYPHGIAQEHIIWLFRRTLSILGYAHSRGVLHGNVEPAHIMVNPVDHNVWLIDWCYAVFEPGRTGQGFKVYNERYSPPEVRERKPPVPSSDMFSAARCMVFALGGDPAAGTFPSHVDERIQRFIQFFLKESPLQRARDAWEMYAQLDILREEVFGPHKFREFKM